ncbi:APOF protein, partial [Steatornis caripensis]|nr:APOF protein [Steatornis caripensis]
MPQALLFLLLLRGLGGSALPSGPVTDDRAAARALLAQLAQHIPPRALPGSGVSCQDLRPEALPGFAQLPPPPRTLARAAMALVLSGAACAPQAEAEVLGLSRELGPTTAAALLWGLPCMAPARLHRPPAGTHPAPPGVPAEGMQVLLGARAWLPACRRVAWHRSRRRRADENPCNLPGEQEAHGVLSWVPGVSTFYSLGTSLYYAFQGCEALASTRALEVAEDLGYAGLAALTAGVSGPVALGLQLGLKAGVRSLINYLTSDGDPPPAPTTHSGPVLIV